MNNYSYSSISMHMIAVTSTKKLLIGNLPDSTQNAAVENLFSVVGPVLSVNVVRNGFAFVEMASDEESNKAIAGLNNKEIEGRAMSVSVAKEKPKRADNKRW